MEPVQRLLIRRDQFGEGYSELAVTVDESGSIVLEGVNAGEKVKRFFGDGRRSHGGSCERVMANEGSHLMIGAFC